MTLLGLATVSGALALSVLTLSAPRLPAQATDAKPVDDPESYAVYSALLPDWVARHSYSSGRRAIIVIQAETATAPHCWPSGPPMVSAWRLVLQDLKTENATPRAILPGRVPSVPYAVLPKANIEAIFKDPRLGWRHFYQQYPQPAGFAQLSAVGFDARRTKAIVYFAHHEDGGLADMSYACFKPRGVVGRTPECLVWTRV